MNILTGIINYIKNRPAYFNVFVITVCLVAIVFVMIPLKYPLFANDYSIMVLDNNNDLLRVFTNKKEQWILPPTNKPIPKKLKLAVILYEDRYFYIHPGFDPVALVRALWLNWRFRKTVSGASTITMQCARLMQPKKRTVTGKLLELVQAIKIELLYSKKDIIALYLNHAPYGSNIIGYQAAAYKYFNKSPDQLTWAEAATLAILPNAPSMITPVVNQKKLVQKRNKLLSLIKAKGFIDEQTLGLAKKEPAPDRIYYFPFIAPHIGRQLLSRSNESFVIATTIDKKIQTQAEELLKRQVNYLKQSGINNAAVLIAKTQTGEIKAYLGSNDYFDNDHQGQVDGNQAARSSGSILKPFLYALAMDEGLIIPETLIHDVPTHFKAFSPKNYNNDFNGLVTAKDALTYSLNVPSVRLLNTYGLHSFYLFLQSAGISTLFRHADEYGLPLILGGAEVKLEEMVMLYQGLGRMGKFESLKLIKNEVAQSAARQLIHPGSCYLTLEMIRDLRRPGAEHYWEQYQNQYPLAWKTGTSYGHRDAWAIGVSPEWTIGVWTGNFVGEGNANLSGARSAGPILFDMFNMLPKKEHSGWFKQPENALKEASICLETGFLATEDCIKTKKRLIPKHQKLFRQCPYHHSYFVTNDNQYRVCSLCWQPGRYKKIKRLVYPPHIMQYMRDHGQQITKLPIHLPDCPSTTQERAIEIIYPHEKANIWLPRGVEGHYQKVVAQITHRDSGSRLFWYMDEAYVGETTGKHEKALALKTGWHILEIVDDQGNHASRKFQTVIKSEQIDNR